MNKWTHGTLITPMHGHAAFFGAYVMIVLAVITYALPALTGTPSPSANRRSGLWAFWLQVGGMFGMTMAFAAAGIAQTYLERILGFGYLETQAKIQVHFLMLVATGALFTLGVALFLWDFFFLSGRGSAAAAIGRAAARGRAMTAASGRPMPGRPRTAPDGRSGCNIPRRRRRSTCPSATRSRSSRPVTRDGLPVMLKGPTGCGKTRFVEHMAWRLGRPLVTVACHDDLSARDLTGRYLIRGGETVWLDGPLTLAARVGAICYLDEIVEARRTPSSSSIR